eukprot:403353370
MNDKQRSATFTLTQNNQKVEVNLKKNLLNNGGRRKPVDPTDQIKKKQLMQRTQSALIQQQKPRQSEDMQFQQQQLDQKFKQMQLNLNTLGQTWTSSFSQTPQQYSNPRNRKPLDQFQQTRVNYPSFVKTSNYMIDFNNTQKTLNNDGVKFKPGKDQIFNMEREHRIINPHKMQLLTMKDTDYLPFKPEPRLRTIRDGYISNAPSKQKTDYQMDYPDWGKNLVFREKNPQYPVYSLPFKGKSAYNDGYNNTPHARRKEIQGEQERFRQTSTSRLSKIKLQAFVPPEVTYQTSMQNDYKPFIINHLHTKQQKQEQQMCKPKGLFDYNAKQSSKSQRATTAMASGHYVSQSKLSYQKPNYRPSLVDYIPYP